MSNDHYNCIDSNSKRQSDPKGSFCFTMNYKDPRWKRLRNKILRRDGYMCQESLRYGKRKNANTVHHIFPAAVFPQYQWCEWNLISLDQSVHNEMHMRDSDELTDKGKSLLKRTARKNGIAEEIFMDYIAPPGR